MVKCRNKKDLYYKPARFALYIRSQSLSAVFEMRVLFDGCVIFHGRCMWCPSFRVRPAHVRRDVFKTLFASLLVYLTVTKAVLGLCDWVCFSHMAFLTYALWLIALLQMKNSLGLAWGIAFKPELSLFFQICGRTIYINADLYCNQQTSRVAWITNLKECILNVA